MTLIAILTHFGWKLISTLALKLVVVFPLKNRLISSGFIVMMSSSSTPKRMEPIRPTGSLLFCGAGSSREEPDDFSEPVAGIFFSCVGSIVELGWGVSRPLTDGVVFAFSGGSEEGVDRTCGGVILTDGVSRISSDFERTDVPGFLSLELGVGSGSRTSFLDDGGGDWREGGGVVGTF